MPDDQRTKGCQEIQTHTYLITDLPDCQFATKFGNQVIVTLITTKLASYFIPEINAALCTERC